VIAVSKASLGFRVWILGSCVWRFACRVSCFKIGRQDLEAARVVLGVPAAQLLVVSSLLLSSLELSDTKVYEPYIRARLRTTAHFCEVVVPPPNVFL